MDASERVVRLQVECKQFRIKHPRLQAAHAEFAVKRKVFTKTIGLPQKILPVIGPSGSGKSTIVRSYAEGVVREMGPSSNRPFPILHVTLSADATVKSLANDILQSLGSRGLPAEIVADMQNRNNRIRVRRRDPWRDLATTQLMYAATQALRSAEVEMLFIDELHHLISKESRKTAWNVTETLKVLADTGVCGICVIGTYEAERLLSAETNPQFANRCGDEMSLDPLDLSLKDEANLFVGYVVALGNKIGKAGGFSAPQNLTRDDFVPAFFDVSAGVLGVVSNLVEKAAEYAILRDADRIEREDLALATSRWAMRLKITDHNPFASGASARDVKQVRARRKH